MRQALFIIHNCFGDTLNFNPATVRLPHSPREPFLFDALNDTIARLPTALTAFITLFNEVLRQDKENVSIQASQIYSL